MNILDTLKDTPEITEGLLRYLDKTFPLSEAKSLKSAEDLFRFQGTQQVIDHLRSLHDEQQRE